MEEIILIFMIFIVSSPSMNGFIDPLHDVKMPSKNNLDQSPLSKPSSPYAANP